MKINKSSSLRLSSYLIYYRTDYSESSRYRLTLSASKSRKVSEDGDRGGTEIPGEF